MRLVRLSKKQTASHHPTNPVFDHHIVIDNDENNQLILRFLKGEPVRDEVILSNLHLVKHTVGRYLANWPDTRRFEDAMVSAGIQGLIETVDRINHSDKEWFRPKAVIRIKYRIEEHLNRNRTMVSASLSTNYRRIRSGRAIESVPDQPLNEELL